MEYAPRGAIVRTMRLAEVETDAEGTERKRVVSGGGVVVHIHTNTDARRAFTRFCSQNGLIATPCESNAYADGTYNRRTGAVVRQGDALPTSFQVIGPGLALAELVGTDAEGRRLEAKWFVSGWAFAVAVRVPHIAGGNGPEKVRPSMGSAFGKPLQVKATATAVARQIAQAVAMANKAN